MTDELTDLDAYGEFGVPVLIIEKSSREQVRIGINEFKGAEYIDIRSFYDVSGGFRPSKKGVTIPTRLYGELVKGILELGSTLGVLDEPDGVTPAKQAKGAGQQSAQ